MSILWSLCRVSTGRQLQWETMRHLRSFINSKPHLVSESANISSYCRDRIQQSPYFQTWPYHPESQSEYLPDYSSSEPWWSLSDSYLNPPRSESPIVTSFQNIFPYWLLDSLSGFFHMADHSLLSLFLIVR